MKYLLLAATCLSLSSAAAFSQESTNVITNPCERGPIPSWRIINSPRAEFVAFVQGVRPNMPAAVAEDIVFKVCDDVSLVGDNDGLTRRLNLLMNESGY